MDVLGISALYHDSAAALVRNGVVVAAAQEERFTRLKGDSSFPGNAISCCLNAAEISLDQIDYIAYYDKPLLTFDRLLETYLAFAPIGLRSFIASMPVWTKNKMFLAKETKRQLKAFELGELDTDRLRFCHHHHSHAASAYYPSPFKDAAVLIMDGVGEWATTSLGKGKGKDLELFSELRFPHSLGLLYSAFTYYLGFAVNEGEYKVMGLAPYGEPKYVQTIYDNLIDVKADGSFRLNMKYFSYCTGLKMVNSEFENLFVGPARVGTNPIEQRHMDLARSVQVVTEEIVLRLCHTLYAQTGATDLCLAGGVALNSVANGRIIREGPFERLWIQPAAGDAGGALGAALAVANANTSADDDRAFRDDSGDGMNGAYLGPSFCPAEIHQTLEAAGAVYHDLEDDQLFKTVAALLATENVVGWFQGRMEFGPRALGNRSILADARSPHMQHTLNMKIKYRESFRPFAPAVLADQAANYFDMKVPSPYMLLVDRILPSRRREVAQSENHSKGMPGMKLASSDIPAVTHVDYSARVQTVDGETNPRFFRLLKEFHAKTGCGVLVNTSFNIRGEPIVCTPADAYECFLGTEMDVLVLGNSILYKNQQ
jgi:carbamoyltransferase